MNIAVTELKNPYFYMWVFICILQTAVTSWAYLRCLKVKVSKPVLYLVMAFGYAVLPIMLRFIMVGKAINLVPFLTLAVPIILTILITADSKIKVIMFNVISLLIDSIVEIMLHIMIRSFDFYANMFKYDSEKVMISVLLLFLVTPLKYIMAAVWNRIVNKSENKISWSFIVFPIAQALAYTAMMLQNLYWNERSFSSFYLILAAMLIFAVSDIFFLYFITDLEKKKSLEQELKTIEYTRLLEEKHYETIEAKRYETAKIRHDIKNQLAAMQILISSGKLSDTKELMAELEKSIDNTKEYEYCSVPIVNAIIGEKATLCEMNNIILTADIRLDAPEGIAKNHLCCIFSNLLDNAIKAAVKLDDVSDRHIQIKAAQKHNVILISCKNLVPCNSENRKLDPQKSSGYGLKILRDIAMQYNGSFDIESADGTCTAVIAIVTDMSNI
ncbi:MAG: GHKL domain-containing protein [Oscillospiraceae bacterium]|nr:GHKL domain-containing protein [Oscillospiraceae bacterium]